MFEPRLWCVQAQTWNRSQVYTLEELECKICYNRYDSHSRKPKLLGCLHRVCAKCLKKMINIGEQKSPRQQQHISRKPLLIVIDFMRSLWSFLGSPVLRIQANVEEDLELSLH